MSGRQATLVTREAFIRCHGDIYEHSPWVAERAWDAGAADALGDIDALHAVMKGIVEAAAMPEKLALLRAHPDLAQPVSLTDHSRVEQASAGLDACTPEEAATFETLNAAYRARFDFPFILAVKGLRRDEVLAAFRARISNTPAQEFAIALDEVHKIALLRLKECA